jgi:hypothetical protein
MGTFEGISTYIYRLWELDKLKMSRQDASTSPPLTDSGTLIQEGLCEEFCEGLNLDQFEAYDKADASAL